MNALSWTGTMADIWKGTRIPVLIVRERVTLKKMDKKSFLGREDMKCPKCRSRTEVTDSRLREGNIVWRRRRCVNCNHKIKTFEQEEEPRFKGMIVILNDNERNIYEMTDEELEAAIFEDIK